MSGMYLSVSSGLRIIYDGTITCFDWMGMDFNDAGESIRFSVGRQTTKEEIEKAIDMVVDAVSYVRKTEGYVTDDEILEVKHEN